VLAFRVALAQADLKVSSPTAKLTAKIRLRVCAATAVLAAIVAVQPFLALLALFCDKLAALASWA